LGTKSPRAVSWIGVRGKIGNRKKLGFEGIEAALKTALPIRVTKKKNMLTTVIGRKKVNFTDGKLTFKKSTWGKELAKRAKKKEVIFRKKEKVHSEEGPGMAGRGKFPAMFKKLERPDREKKKDSSKGE